MAKNRGYFNEFKRWYEANYGEMKPRESTPEEKVMRAAAVTRATDQEIQKKRQAEEGLDPGFAEYLRQRGITLRRKPPEHVQNLNAQLQSKTLSPLGRQGIFPIGSKELQGNSKKSPYQLAIEQYSRKTGAEEKEASIRNTTPEMHNAFQPLVDESAYRRTKEGAYAAKPYTGGLKGSLRPVGGLIGYSVSGLGSAIEGVRNIAQQSGTGKKVTPHDTINDFREKAYAEGLKRRFKNAFGGKEDGVTTRGEQISGFAADVGLSTVGSASKIAVGNMLGIPPEIIMSAAAANSTLAELNQNENIDARQAALVAGLHGGVEAATEGLSLGNLKNFETIAAKSAKGVLKEIGKQMVVEASEEMASEVANSFIDRAYLGREAGFNQAVRSYMDSGMSEGAAKRQAYIDLGKNTALAGLAGGLSGGLMGGGATAVNYAGMSAAGRNGFLSNYNTAEDYGMIAENVSDETEAGKKAIETARDYENRVRSGERITDAEKGELESLLYETTQAENKKYGTGQYDAIAAAVDADRGHYAESDAYERALRLKMAAETLAAKEAEGKEITAFEKSALRQLMDDAGELIPADAHSIEAVRDVEPVKAMQTEPLRTAQAEPAPFSTPAAAVNPLYERAGARSLDVVNDDGLMNDIASNYAENGAQAFKMNYAPDMGIRNYSKAFSQIYNAARYGLKQGEMNTAVTSMLDSGTLENIFKSGVRDRQQLDRKLTTGGSYKVRQEQRSGGLMDKVPETPKNLSKVLDTLGKNTGIQFIVTNTARYNGMYKEGDGVVVVDLSAANPLSTVSHEMTHWMREYNAEGYIKFRDAAASALTRNGMDLEEEIEKYRDAYRGQQGQELSRDEAIEEIVADSTGMYLNDEQFIRETVQGNLTMAQRVVEWLKSVCDALKELISDRGLSRAARYMAKDLAVYERARDLWMEEIGTARDAFEMFEPESETKTGDKFQIANPSEATPEKMEENYKTVARMNPVLHLTGNEFMEYSDTKQLAKDELNYLKENSDDGVFKHPVIGKITAVRKGTVNDVAHGVGWVKRITIAAIPDTLKNGKLLRVDKNWKERGYDSIAIGNKIAIDEGKYAGNYFVVAILKSGDDYNNFSLHEAQILKVDTDSTFNSNSGVNTSVSNTVKYPLLSNIFDKLQNYNSHDKEFITEVAPVQQDRSDLKGIKLSLDLKDKESSTRQIRDLRPSNDKLRQLSSDKSIAPEADGSKYNYESLVKKEDMQIRPAAEYGFDTIQYRKDLTRNEVADAIFNNIEAYNEANKTGLGRKALRNKEIGTVQVKVGAIKHGLIRMGSVNYAAYESLPMIVDNAIVVNEAEGLRNAADKAYIMFGAFADGQDIHVARLVVNHYETGNELENVEALYSFRAKKEGAALNGAPSRQITASGSPSFIVSIAELLNGIKEDYPDMLPEDVLNRFGLERSGKEDIENLRYQLDISEEDMPRADLIAENAELKRANEYLTGMLNSYKDLTPSERDIHKVVKGLADEFGYNGDLAPIEEKVGRFYNYLRTAEGIDGEEVTRVAAALANEIVDKAEHIDPKVEKVWKDFRKTMRSTRIYIPESNIADYAPDGWNDFRKEWFGKIIFTKSKEYSNGVYDGAAVYRRLQEQFADYFTAPADGMTDDEAIHHIMEAFDLQKPMAEPAYRGADKDEVSLILGQRILEAYALVGDQDVRAQYNKSYKEFARQAEDRIRKGYIKALEEQRIENAGELKKLKRRFDASEIGLEAYIISKKALLDFEEQKKQAAARQWRKSREEYEDSRKKSAYKKEIIRNTEKLTRMLNQPTDKAHVPAFMLNDLKDVVDHISFTLSPQRKDGQLKQWAQEGTTPRLMKSGAELKVAFTRVTDGLQAITDNGSIYTDGKGTEYYVVVDPDIITCLKQIPAMLTEEGVAAENLDQLSAYQLSIIRDTMASLNRMVESAGNFIANEHYKSINEAAEKTIEELSKRKDAVNVDGRLAGGMQSMFRAGMLDAYTYFDIMGESGKAIYDEVRSALDKKIRNTRTAQDYMMEVRKREGLTDREMSSWSRELKEIELVTRDRNGNYRKKTAQVTDAQLMSLYLLNKRGQARMHIYGNEKNASTGGVKFAAVKAGALKKTDGVTVYKMDEATVNRLIGQLSEKQRAVADAVGHFLTDVTSDWGNEVTMTLYGYKKFTASNYFPIEVDDNTIGKDSKALEGSITLLKNMGSTKSVQQKAYNPLVLHDIFDVYTEQADKMGSYNAFVVATADMQKWFNYRTEETNIRQEMERALGGDANEYFMNLLRDINGSRAKADKYERFYDFAGNYKAARIGANLRVAIQQPTAYTRAAAEMDVKYLMKGLWMTPNEAAAEWEKCKEYAPIAQWKDWGYFDINVGRSMKSLICGQASKLEKLKEGQMWAAGKMDTVAWVRLWKAAQEQVKDQQPELKEGSDEFYREAGRVFSHIIDTTQVVDSVLHRTDMMKSKSAYVKSITSFLAEPMKSYNMIYREAMKVKAGDAGAKKKLTRVIVVYMIGNTLTDAAAAVADAMRNDDRDKEFIEKWFDAFIGDLISAFTDEDMAFSERAKIILLEISDKTGVSNIPFVKGIISRIAGYKQDDMAMRWADEVINAMNETGKFVSGKSKQGTLGYLYKVSDVGDFFGISTKNAMKDTGGLLNSFLFPTAERLGIASEDTLRYEELKLMKNIGHKDNLKAFVMEAIRAYADGERELGDRIMEDLIETGYDDKRIRESIENQLGKEEEFEIAAQAYVDNDMKAYEENRKKLIASGYKEEMVDEKLQSRSDNIMQDIASYSLIADALLSGDADAAETAYDKLMEYKKRRNPEKKPEDIEKEVRKQIKSNISGRYKEDYVSLPKKRAEIKQKLSGIQLKRKRLYTGDDYGKWYKE